MNVVQSSDTVTNVWIVSSFLVPIPAPLAHALLRWFLMYVTSIFIILYRDPGYTLFYAEDGPRGDGRHDSEFKSQARPALTVAEIPVCRQPPLRGCSGRLTLWLWGLRTLPVLSCNDIFLPSLVYLVNLSFSVTVTSQPPDDDLSVTRELQRSTGRFSFAPIFSRSLVECISAENLIAPFLDSFSFTSKYKWQKRIRFSMTSKGMSQPAQ